MLSSFKPHTNNKTRMQISLLGDICIYRGAIYMYKLVIFDFLMQFDPHVQGENSKYDFKSLKRKFCWLKKYIMSICLCSEFL